MKRDWRLIREVLRWAEGDVEARVPATDAGEYAVSLAYRSGYILAFDGDFGRGPTLTPAGHDLIDAIRDNAVWTRLSAIIAAFGGMPSDLLVEIARSIPATALTHEGMGPGALRDASTFPCDLFQFLTNIGSSADTASPTDFTKHLR